MWWPHSIVLSLGFESQCSCAMPPALHLCSFCFSSQWHWAMLWGWAVLFWSSAQVKWAPMCKIKSGSTFRYSNTLLLFLLDAMHISIVVQNLSQYGFSMLCRFMSSTKKKYNRPVPEFASEMKITSNHRPVSKTVSNVIIFYLGNYFKKLSLLCIATSYLLFLGFDLICIILLLYWCCLLCSIHHTTRGGQRSKYWVLTAVVSVQHKLQWSADQSGSWRTMRTLSGLAFCLLIFSSACCYYFCRCIECWKYFSQVMWSNRPSHLVYCSGGSSPWGVKRGCSP